EQHGPALVPQRLPDRAGDQWLPFVRRAGLGRVEHASDRGAAALEALVEDGKEQVVLALEVRVHGAFGEPGRGGDVVQGRTLEAVAGEHHRRCLEQVLAGHGPPPLGCEGFEGRHRASRTVDIPSPIPNTPRYAGYETGSD